jgi:hypothetical protein
MREVHDQLRAAFIIFDKQLNSTPLVHARENELVSLFTFDALLNELADGRLLSSPTQLGIGVACRPKPKASRTKPTACKDLVI